jgi:DNA polymerase-1
MPQDLEKFKHFISVQQEKKSKFIMHNGKFDAVRILWSYGIDLKIDHDTMILAYLRSTVDELKDNRGKWLGLKYAAPRWLGVENWDVTTSKKTSTSDKDVIPYLRLDCKYTYLLYKRLTSDFPKEKIKTYKLIMHAINAYKYIETNGLCIDMVQLEETLKDYYKDKEELDAKLITYKDINYNSSKQLQDYLFNELGLPVLKYTKKGAASTGVAELKELESEHPIVPLILKKREIEKAISFLDAWKEEAILHPDGHYYLHSNFNLHGTVTGRTSSSDVNLQQIPRNKKLKSLFKSTKPGWQMVCMDYSQLELRFAGLVGNVQAIKDSYSKGEDLHYKMAATITGKPVSEVTKEERTQAKAANFGFLYGMQAKSFVEYAKVGYGVEVSEEQAMLIRERFFELYPELLLYYEDVRTALMTESRQTSIMQRVYEVNPIKLYNTWERENIIRPAINFPVQSAGSDYVISGIVEVMNHPLLKDRVKLGATVHDSIIGLVKEDEHFYETLALIKSIMEYPGIARELITVDIDLPIVVDIEIGPLGKGISMEEYKELKNEQGYKKI